MAAHRSRIPADLLAVDAEPNAHDSALMTGSHAIIVHLPRRYTARDSWVLLGVTGFVLITTGTHSIGELGVLKREGAIDFAEAREVGVY
jgi:hypothetical protein